LLDEDMSNIVITPYVALTDQLKDYCSQIGLDCIIWKPGCQQRANIVMVVVDTATTPEFRHYLSNLSARSKLGTWFLDELHVYYMEASWRQRIVQIFDLIIPTSIVFMSATHPPSMEPIFNKLFSINDLNPTTVRGLCVRPTISYSVQKVPKEIDLINATIQLLESEITSHVRRQEKILVFAPQIKQLAEIQSRLGKACCGLYHAKEENKAEVLQQWKDGVFPILCASTALGAGMDVRRVELVVHVDFIYDIFAFVQGSGRAGRDGEQARSITLLKEEWFQRDKRVVNQSQGALVAYAKADTCRQEVLSNYFNGTSDKVNCFTLEGNPCDVCSKITTSSSNLGLARARDPDSPSSHKRKREQATVEASEREEKQLTGYKPTVTVVG